ncbi:MAG: hypothetical protein HZA36_02450 [Parcubacteria group bacterium]|nr:hypothetical protein [Parcubacteria group bacterium]
MRIQNTRFVIPAKAGIQKKVNLDLRVKPEDDKKTEFLGNTRERGQVMMLTVLLLSLAFSLASFLAGSIIVYQVRAASTITSAMVAVFAGDSGLQCGLYKTIKGADDASFVCPLGNASYMMNGATFDTSVSLTASSTLIRSKGVFRDTSRALEASF